MGEVLCKEKVILDTNKRFLAESKGFEPLVPCGTTVFKTAAFDHSATPLFYLGSKNILISRLAKNTILNFSFNSFYSNVNTGVPFKSNKYNGGDKVYPTHVCYQDSN